MGSARVYTHPAVARNRFRAMMDLPDAALDLSEAALVIALEAYPWLEIDRYLDRMDEWSDIIRDRVRHRRDVETLVTEINRFLFDQEGFHGETADYYDPRNTYLNDVLDRHAGLPIALSILWLEVSRRVGVAATGIALPGRCLVRVASPWGDILLDPFDGGRVLSIAECQQLIDHAFGGAVHLREQHFRPYSKREILARLLAHLKAVYMAHDDLAGAAGAIDRLLLVDDRDPFELRDRAALRIRMHRYAEAIEDLERYLAIAPHAEDAPRIRQKIAYITGWLSQN